MKRKVFVKNLSFLMAAILSVSVLAGCTGKGKDEKETSSSDSTAQVSAVETSTAANSDEPGWQQDNSPVTLDWFMGFSWFGAKWGEDITSKYITKKTGITLNYIVPAGNETEKLNTMIASNSLPDVITVDKSWSQVDKLISADMVYSLTDLADKHDPYFYKAAKKETLDWVKKDDGKVYGYPNYADTPESVKAARGGTQYTVSNYTFEVRKDMYEAIGKPDMRTPEGFLNALKLAKEKFPNVNGQPMIPLGVHEFNDAGCISFQGMLCDFLNIAPEKDGSFVNRDIGIEDPEYLNWMKTFRKANEMGLINQSIFVDKRSQIEEKQTQGRYFAMLYQWSDFQASQNDLYKKDPNSIYVAIDGPANSKMDDPTFYCGNAGGWTTSMITKNCKVPDRAIKFFSYWISEEGQKDFYLGEPETCWQTIDGKDQWIPELMKMRTEDSNKYYTQYGVEGYQWALINGATLNKYIPDAPPQFMSLVGWYKGKNFVFNPAQDVDPKGGTELGTTMEKIKNEWARTLPKLITAKTDAEFDKVWNSYLEKRNSLGYDKVMDYSKQQTQKAKEKLGLN